MRQILIAITLVVAGAFTAVAAWRLSVDALALVLGLLLGIAAIVPTMLLVLWTVRARSTSLADMPPPAAQHLPPVIVVQPSYPQALAGVNDPARVPQLPVPQATNWPSPAPSSANERRWAMRVWGEDAEQISPSGDWFD